MVRHWTPRQLITTSSMSAPSVTVTTLGFIAPQSAGRSIPSKPPSE